jgi:hypothetical protein
MKKLPSYLEVLKMTKESISNALAPVRAMRARKQAELEIAKMDEQIASQEAKINELCAEKEIDFNKIIAAQDSLCLMERRKKQCGKIVDEMFPD